METENNQELSMTEQAALNKRNKIAKANGQDVEEPQSRELPKGTAAENETEKVLVENSVAEALGDGDAQTEEVSAAPAVEEEEPIRIAGKTFKTQKEAIEYAEKLEQEKLIAEAHAQGVREALVATQTQAAAPKEEEEDFETKFYSNPKETLREIQSRARDEAVAMIRQETAREKAWNEFLSEYPDIRRQDAETILASSAAIGRLPWDEGRKALASAVYKEYDEIANLRRPKTELTQKKLAVSPSGGRQNGVTPKNNDEKPLSFVQQVRQNRKY
jgi:hypothetical protein